jgi:hypothetical protein
MRRVGIVFWAKGDGIALLHAQIVKGLDFEPVEFYFDQKLPASLDLILTFGPWGSMVPLVNQVISLPGSQRPKFVWWLSEQLPNPDLPEWLLYLGGYLRNHVERLAYRQRTDGTWKMRRGIWKFLTSKAKRYRYFGDLYWLHKQGILTRVVLEPGWINQLLTRRGFNVYTPPTPSSYPEWGNDLNLVRDIPVLWIGKVATKRRRRLLDFVAAGLKKQGIELLRIDGEHHRYIYGEERTRLLNRTKVVLNLLRARWDNNDMRFHLAALNRALIVTEPMIDHIPYQSGIHLIEARVEEIPEKIIYYLTHEEER